MKEQGKKRKGTGGHEMWEYESGRKKIVEVCKEITPVAHQLCKSLITKMITKFQVQCNKKYCKTKVKCKLSLASKPFKDTYQIISKSQIWHVTLISGLISRIMCNMFVCMYICKYACIPVSYDTEWWHYILNVFVRMQKQGMDSLGQRLTGVNWFVRANELSPVNQGLMRYPGTGNLVRELEQVSLNVRHTWHTVKAGRKVDQESEFYLKMRCEFEKCERLLCRSKVKIERDGGTL